MIDGFALGGRGKTLRYRPLKVAWRYQMSDIRSVTLSEHTRQKDDWGSQAQVTQTQQRTVSEPRSHKFVRLLWITHLSGSYLELSLTFPPVVLIRDQRLIVSQLVQLPSSLVAPAARVPTVVITRIE